MPHTTTCRRCGTAITGETALDALEFFIHPGCEAAPMDERDRQLLALRAASPKRAEVGRVIAAQRNANDCPLFAAAEQGKLL